MTAPTYTRADADRDGLIFLRDHGPHTLPNPLETEEAICAALVFIDLTKRGLATRINFSHGNVQFSISEAGRRAVL